MVLQNFPRFKRFCIGQVRCKYATAKSSPCFWLSGLHLSFMIHSTLDCSDSRTHVCRTFITSSQPLPLTNKRDWSKVFTESSGFCLKPPMTCLVISRRASWWPSSPREEQVLAVHPRKGLWGTVNVHQGHPAVTLAPYSRANRGRPWVKTELEWSDNLVLAIERAG